MLTTIHRTAEGDLEALLDLYPWRDITGAHTYQVELPCPDDDGRQRHANLARRGECICDRDGIYRPRIPWVNTSRVWAAKLGADTFIMMEFAGSLGGYWFAMDMLPGEAGHIALTGDLNFKCKDRGHASSCDCAPERSGGAIRRYPDTLRGFCYRTLVNGRDGYILPKDIVTYLQRTRALRTYL